MNVFLSSLMRAPIVGCGVSIFHGRLGWECKYKYQVARNMGLSILVLGPIPDGWQALRLCPRKSSSLRISESFMVLGWRQMVQSPNGIRRGCHSCWGTHVRPRAWYGYKAIPSVMWVKPSFFNTWQVVASKLCAGAIHQVGASSRCFFKIVWPADMAWYCASYGSPANSLRRFMFTMPASLVLYRCW